MAIGYRGLNSKLDKEGNRVDQFGNEYSFMNEIENMYPIYWQGLKEIEQEDPDLLVRFLEFAGFFGLNSQVYGNESKKFNSIQGRGERTPVKRKKVVKKKVIRKKIDK